MRVFERLSFLKEMRRGKNGLRHRMIFALKVVVALSLMGLALRNVSIKSQVANWSSLNVTHMALACFVIALGQGVSALRWVVILRRWNVPLTLSQAFRLNMVGMFFNLVFPTSVGGDVVKGFFLTRHSGKGAESFTSVILTRFIGLVVLLLLGFFSGIVFAWSLLPRWMLLGLTGIIVASLAIGLVVLRSSWLFRWSRGPETGFIGKTRHVVRIIHEFSADYWAFFQVILLSLLVQILAIHGYYESALAIGVRTSYLNFLVFMPLVTFVTMIPISIFGLGIRENAFIYLFQFVGITKALSVSMSLTWLAAYLFVSLFGGIFLISLDDSFLVRRSAGEQTIAPERAVPKPDVEGSLE